MKRLSGATGSGKEMMMNGFAEVSTREMEEVDGGFGIPGAVAGAVVGAIGYLGNSATSGNFSVGSFVATVAGGALLGAIGGPVTSAARAYFTNWAAFGVGAVSGRIK